MSIPVHWLDTRTTQIAVKTKLKARILKFHRNKYDHIYSACMKVSKLIRHVPIAMVSIKTNVVCSPLSSCSNNKYKYYEMKFNTQGMCSRNNTISWVARGTLSFKCYDWEWTSIHSYVSAETEVVSLTIKPFNIRVPLHINNRRMCLMENPNRTPSCVHASRSQCLR